MEVLYHIGPSGIGIFPYIGVEKMHFIYIYISIYVPGTSHQLVPKMAMKPYACPDGSNWLCNDHMTEEIAVHEPAAWWYPPLKNMS